MGVLGTAAGAWLVATRSGRGFLEPAQRLAAAALLGKVKAAAG